MKNRDGRRERRYVWRLHTGERLCYAFTGEDTRRCGPECAAYCQRAVAQVRSVYSEITGDFEEMTYGHPVVLPYCIDLESALADMVEEEVEG